MQCATLLLTMNGRPTLPATPEFLNQLHEAFDSIQAGQTFIFRRTFTEGNVTLFCGVTGDYNPYHIDKTFARSSSSDGATSQAC